MVGTGSRTRHRRRLFFLHRATLLPFPPSLLLPVPSSPFRSRPLNTARGSGERCKLSQWGLGRSPSRQTIWCILESKRAALVAAVSIEFRQNKCNFLHKNKLDTVRRYHLYNNWQWQRHRSINCSSRLTRLQIMTLTSVGRCPMRRFSRGLSPPLPMEVGPYDYTIFSINI